MAKKNNNFNKKYNKIHKLKNTGRYEILIKYTYIKLCQH